MDNIEFKPTNYPSDLTDAQWELIEEFFPQGPNSEYHKRSLVNAVLYLIDNGCKWRAMPHDFPPCQTVSSFYRRARIKGIWAEVQNMLVEMTRIKAGKNPGPTYGIIDSQSVKTVYASEERGIDGGKNERPQASHCS
jgi:putative transposase